MARKQFLGGAFALERATPVEVAERKDVAKSEAPAKGTGDEVSSTSRARGLALLLLAVGVVVAWLMKEKDVGFKPGEGFVLFAGFYVAAQSIERLLELLPVGVGSKQSKANRAVVFPALGFILAVVMAEWIGLFYLQAVGITGISKNWDIIITALAIGGGTKPLHDGIKLIEKSKETPPTTT
jgi:hypothetical protein